MEWGVSPGVGVGHDGNQRSKLSSSRLEHRGWLGLRAGAPLMMRIGKRGWSVDKKRGWGKLDSVVLYYDNDVILSFPPHNTLPSPLLPSLRPV